MVEALDSKVLKLVQTAIGPIRIGDLQIWQVAALRPGTRFACSLANERPTGAGDTGMLRPSIAPFVMANFPSPLL